MFGSLAPQPLTWVSYSATSLYTSVQTSSTPGMLAPRTRKEWLCVPFSGCATPTAQQPKASHGNVLCARACVSTLCRVACRWPYWESWCTRCGPIRPLSTMCWGVDVSAHSAELLVQVISKKALGVFQSIATALPALVGVRSPSCGLFGHFRQCMAIVCETQLQISAER